MTEMKKILFAVSAVCFLLAFILVFALVGYSFSGYILFLAGTVILFLAKTHGVTKKRVLHLRRVLFSCLCLGVIFCIVITSVVLHDAPGDADIPCDYVIVLGAGLQKDVPSRTLADRLIRAENYMKSHPESIAIVSGAQGSGETVTEAFAMKRWLASRGIDESRILEEDRARNTNENLKFSKEIIDGRGGGSVAIISSDYHIYRSKKLAVAHGIDATMLAAPTTLTVLRLNYALREGAALIKAMLLQHI